MKYVVVISLLFFFAGVNTSCKKTIDTVVKTDTVTIRDTLRDTTYIQLLRTDIYTGSTTLIDYPRGMRETVSGWTFVRFYANDSTNYSVNGNNRPGFMFSIVSGHFWFPSSLMSVTSTFVAPDSLYITGEDGPFNSPRGVVFSGKKY